MKVITVTNQKGGTTKTSTALYLTYGLANRGKHVLLIDLDQQADASFSMHVAYDLEATTFQVLTRKKKLEDIIVKVNDAIDLAPASRDLSQLDLTRPWLLLDNVQDPGNIGTMVRTADAAGFAGVAFGTGTVDIHQPKVERAMQGSQFHLQLISTDLDKLVDQLQAQGSPVYGSELNPQAARYLDIDAPASFGLIMGNEGNGMSRELLARTDQNLYIPIKGQAESLNVAVAAGVLMFGLYR